MSYLSVAKLSTYQHYKNRRPVWVKLYVSLLDIHHPLNRLPLATRFLFDRMLLLAANYDNAIPNDSELLAKLLCMEHDDCREGIDQLLKGRWIVERSTKRRASKPASEPLANSLHQSKSKSNKDLVDRNQFRNSTSGNGNFSQCPKCGIRVRPPTTLADHLWHTHDIEHVA